MNKAVVNADLPSALYEAVERELNPTRHGAGRPRETVLWTGQPDAHRTALSTVPLVLFGIPWTLFAVFWTVMATHGAFLFGLFGVPFVLVGLGMLTSPFWAAHAARRTAYVLTNRRILFVTLNNKSTTVKNYVPENESDLERTERANGRGDLVFLRRPTRDSDGDRATEKIAFTGIPDVRGVEQLLRDTFFAPQAVAIAEESNRLGHTVSVTPSTPQTTTPWYTAYRG